MKRANFGVKELVFRPLDWALIVAINFYQKRISPRKGWRCAHCRLHGGPSCSGYVKSAILNHGWRAAKPMARKRFVACKQAGRILRAQDDSPWSSTDEPMGTPEPNPSPGNQNQNPNQKKKGCDADCSGLTCCDTDSCKILDRIFDCGPGDSGCIDCNCSPCD